MARHEREALWAFASDELDEGARLRAAEHLASCEACTRKLAEVRQAQTLLRTAREEAPPVRWAEVDDRIQTAAARRFARLERSRWPWALVPLGALAAVLAFVLLRPVAAPPSPIVAPPPVLAERPAPPAVEPEAPVESPAPAEAPVLATQVESATGAWLREAGAEERSLQKGTQLRAGASVRTPAKASALLRLPDTSRVRLSPDSEVTLARTEARDVHLTVTRGRLAVRASHAARRGFTVEAAGVRASVVGTVFSVERTARGAVVAVLEGKVRVEAEDQPPRFVSAGERVEIRPGEREPKVRALSARDRQAFQELEPQTEPASTSRPASGGPARPGEPAPALAVAPPVPAPPESTVSEAPSTEPLPPPETRPAEGPMSALDEAGSEFAPYPAPTSPEPVGTVVVAPSPASPASPQGLAAQQPGGAPSSADANFLSHAQAQLTARTCEGFLVGLAEIAERSPVRDYREQARYLRARCFEERLVRSLAAAEYRRYLREFPRGRYVKEALTALLP